MSLAELWALEKNQISRINKDVLVNIIVAARDSQDHPPNPSSLQNKLDDITKELADIKNKILSPDSTFNRKITQMQEQIDQQADVISKQQHFLEAMDRKERETKLVVLGVPDEGESLAGETSDDGKIRKIWQTLGEPVNVESHRRLGREPGGRKRPILVTLPSKQVREELIKKAHRLKDAGESFAQVYVKRDMHPAVRNEWKRLRDAEVAEKAKPGNLGCVIRLDTRSRKLYRDDAVIDS